MRKIVKLILIIAIIAMVIGIANRSSAFSFNANLSSNGKLVAGQEVKITLSLSNINMDDGIRSIRIGKITVGEEFEPVASANFVSNTWSPTYLNGGLVLMSGTPVKTNGTAVTLTLKVKSGVTAKSSTVKFENIVASSGTNTGDISVGTQIITIKAEETETSGNEVVETNTVKENEIVTGGNKTEINENVSGTTNTSDTNTNSTQNGTNQSTDKNNSNAIKNITSSQVRPSKLPNAGNMGGILIVVLILIVILAAIVSLVKYKKTR